MQEWLIDLLHKNYDDGIDLLRSDFKVWCENLLRIPDKETGNDIPFVFNPAQNRWWEHIKVLRQRIVRWKSRTLKARQQGLTTEVLAYDLWESWGKRNRNCYMLTDRDELTEEKFLMLKNFYYELPTMESHGFQLQPDHKLDNRGILYLQAKDGSKGLNSKIRVGTVKSKNKGVGMTVYLLHLAEYARYFEITNVTQLMTDLLKAMPKTGSAGVVIETTAYPGPFEHEWYNDKTYDNLFIPFIADTGYRRKPKNNDYSIPLQETEDEAAGPYGNEVEELRLIAAAMKEWFPEKYNEEKLLDPEVMMKFEEDCLDAIHFRRWSIHDECMGDKGLFRQDYPITAEQAFQHAGEHVFDVNLIKAQRQAIIVEPPSPIVEITRPLRLSFTPPRDFDNGWWMDALKESPTGPIYCYIKPNPKLVFAFGADVAEGNLDSDDDSLRGLLCPQQIEAVCYDGIMDLYDFSDMIYCVSMLYNYGLIGIERNNHGMTVIKRMQDVNIHYPVANMYRKKVLDRIYTQPEMRYGWHSNANTKPLMVTNLFKRHCRGEVVIVHPKTFDQMENYFKLPDGGYGGLGSKDDAVSSLMIASMMADEVPSYLTTRQEDHGMTLNHYIALSKAGAPFKPWGGINNA